MKKKFKLFAFAIALFIIGIFNVKADYKIDFSNDLNKKSISYNGNPPFSLHYKVNTAGSVVYCYQPYVSYAGAINDDFSGILNYKCSEKLSENVKQISYILINGYGGDNVNDNDYFNNINENDQYYATQIALWFFGDKRYWQEAGKDSDYFENFKVDKDGKCTFNGTTNNIIKIVTQLITDANKSVNAKESIALNISDTKLNVNSDRSYYISGPIKINGSWVKKSIKVSVSGATGAFITKDSNSTSGGTSFNIGDTIYVKVPASNITKNMSLTISASGTSKIGTGTIKKCENDEITESQQLLELIKETPKVINYNLSLTVEPVKVEVKISKLGADKTKQLVGAKLRITDKEGKLTTDLDGKSLEWITTENEEKFHLAEGTYYLSEVSAPAGYIKSDKTIEFVVEKDGTIKINNKEVTEVTMDNEPIYIYISKKSINGKTELPGAKLKITDKEGKLEKDLDDKSLIWTSSTKEEKFHLAPGSYILTELEAPNGYELSDTIIEFTITEDGKILFDKKEAENNMIVFKNTPEPKQTQTGSSLIYILFLGILTAGAVTFFVVKKID